MCGQVICDLFPSWIMERGGKVQDAFWRSCNCSVGCDSDLKTPFLKMFVVFGEPNKLNQDPHKDTADDIVDIDRIFKECNTHIDVPRDQKWSINCAYMHKNNQWNPEIEEKCWTITKEVEISQIFCWVKR